MTIDPNDPILTAYVLDELNDEQRALVERAIESDASLRQTVDEIRTTAQALEHELHAEPAAALTSDQRAYLESRMEPTAEPASFSIHRTAWWAGGITALAACMTVAILFAQYFAGDNNASNDPLAISRDAAPSEDGEALYSMMVDEGASSAGEEMREAKTIREELGALRDASNEAATLGEAAAKSGRASEGERGELERVRGRGNELMFSQAPNQTATASPQLQPRPTAPPPSNTLSVPGGGGGGGASGGMTPPPGAPARRGGAGGAVDDFVRQIDPRSRDQIPAEQDANRPADRRDEPNTENYNFIVENDFIVPRGEQALSTFSIDVDTASFTNTRRFLEAGQLPPPDAVRIEELLNYFKYDDPAPSGDDPFAVNFEVGPAPWKAEHRLVRIGLRGKEIELDNRPPTNLVFLIDVSGSMNRPEKLPLLKKAFTMLVDSLTPDDRVAMAVYAGASGLVLPSTFAYNREQVFHAIDSLSAGGSTNGGAGIELAYNIAQQHFIDGGINRVILATDGDFNVGVSSEGDLVRMIEAKRETGVFLSVLGFGTGNLQDAKMEQLADKGNGQYAYIDSVDEAKRVLVDELGGTLVTIAKDVKVQVEFNPAQVAAYRLIGYENRLLAAQDFADDTKDAGELGAGMSVTALYEIVPVGIEFDQAEMDDLKYQQPAKPVEPEDADEAVTNELMTVKLRYKEPDGDESKLLTFPLVDPKNDLEATSDDFRFASSVAAFGMLLRDSKYRGAADWSLVHELAQNALGEDRGKSRAAFLEMIAKARRLKGEPEPPAEEADASGDDKEDADDDRPVSGNGAGIR